MDREIHLSRRLHSGPVRGAAGGRARGLLVTDIEILRLHYAETLKAWRERFLAHRDEAERLYDQRFTRMWEFYLAAAEMAFREQAMMVFQLQLTKRQGIVPMTRDYVRAKRRGCERSSAEAARRCGWRASDSVFATGVQNRQALRCSLSRGIFGRWAAGKLGKSDPLSHRPC